MNFFSKRMKKSNVSSVSSKLCTSELKMKKDDEIKHFYHFVQFAYVQFKMRNEGELKPYGYL